MLDRITRGQVPPRPHTVVKTADGSLLYEECLTRDGFDGPHRCAASRRAALLVCVSLIRKVYPRP